VEPCVQSPPEGGG